MKRKFSILASLALLICVLFGCSQSTAISPEFYTDDSTALVVHYIDVGQGNSVLLESDNSFMLIDAGEKEYGSVVCDYISSRGTNTLDYVIATHPHSDHIGGMEKVINNFKCKNFITPETDQQTKQWLRVLDAVDKSGADFIDPIAGTTFSFGETICEILAPNSVEYENYNNYSVVLRVVCGNNSFLFTGDAQALSEKEMLNNGMTLSSDVLMIGHHGSTTSTSKDFLKAVNPTYAVISCGRDNEYGHPHLEILQRLKNAFVTYYRTDELGTIIATSDKSNIKFFYTQTDSTVSPTTTATQNDVAASNEYVGNSKSKKFHYDTCESIAKMNEENKVYFSTRQEAVEHGYAPCKNCKP